MLIQFGVKNFFSYKTEQVFTTLATSDKSYADTNLIEFGKNKYSKVNVVFGQNASGKTNLFVIIAFLKWYFRNSSPMYEKDKIKIVPFAFSNECKEMPSEIGIIFVKDGIKYNYSFSCTFTEVVYERLDIYETSKPTMIFERNREEYKFNATLKSQLDALIERNAPNKLFVCTMASWKFKEAQPVVDFVLDDINLILYDNRKTLNKAIEKYQNEGIYDEFKRFCIKLLNIADFGIDDFDFEIEERTLSPEVLQLLDATYRNKMEKVKEYTYHMYHRIKVKDGYELMKLNLEAESNGTQQIFDIAPILFDVLRAGKVLMVDELDSSLHTLLVEFIIKLFLNPDVNKLGAQLICNMHDTSLLSAGLLRRDEIWFVDRDPEQGDSKLYSLSAYSPLKSDNIEKAYLLGRYGAIPYIKGADGIWQ